MTNITSDEVNYLIYRYLLESGFHHSSFALSAESNILKQNIKGSLVQPGCLIRVLQKGLLYMQMESHIQNDGSLIKCVAPYTLLGNHECEILHEDVDPLVELERAVLPVRKVREPKEPKESLREAQHKDVHKELQKDLQKDLHRETLKETHRQTPKELHKELQKEIPKEFHKETRPATPRSEPPQDTPMQDVVSLTFQDADLTFFKGHSAEVFACAWNPTDSLLATGSGDGTARIWKIHASAFANLSSNTSAKEPPIVLAHAPPESPNRDVTTLDWHPSGEVLATGSYEGIARIWTKTGHLKNVLKKHTGPIFALKWNKKGDVLLTGSVDKSAIVWDPSSGEVRQQFEFHSAPCLDVDWRDDITFATCSNDKQIFVCQLGSLAPLKQFSGHKGEVNSVRWDPTGTFLASCSDDFTVKVWTMNSDRPKCDFTGHEKEIYTLRWNPSHASKKLIATYVFLDSRFRGSFDFTVRVFDVEAGQCIYKFTDHQEAVYTVCFSPDSRFLATGSFDQSIKIRDVEDGKIVKTHDAGNGGVFEVAWSHAGDQLAVCYSNSTVIVVKVAKSL